MKTLSVEQFKELIATSGWVHKNSYEVVEAAEDRTYGFGTVTSHLADLAITSYEGFSYTPGDEDSFSADNYGLDKPFEFEGFEVVDEDGDNLRKHVIYELLSSDFHSVDYSGIKESI